MWSSCCLTEVRRCVNTCILISLLLLSWSLSVLFSSQNKETCWFFLLSDSSPAKNVRDENTLQAKWTQLLDRMNQLHRVTSCQWSIGVFAQWDMGVLPDVVIHGSVLSTLFHTPRNATHARTHTDRHTHAAAKPSQAKATGGCVASELGWGVTSVHAELYTDITAKCRSLTSYCYYSVINVCEPL